MLNAQVKSAFRERESERERQLILLFFKFEIFINILFRQMNEHRRLLFNINRLNFLFIFCLFSVLSFARLMKE